MTEYSEKERFEKSFSAEYRQLLQNRADAGKSNGRLDMTEIMWMVWQHAIQAKTN